MLEAIQRGCEACYIERCLLLLRRACVIGYATMVDRNVAYDADAIMLLRAS